MGKSFSDLKKKERAQIQEILFARHTKFVNSVGRQPSNRDVGIILDDAYSAIQQSGIEISKEEVRNFYAVKRKRFDKKLQGGAGDAE